MAHINDWNIRAFVLAPVATTMGGEIQAHIMKCVSCYDKIVKARKAAATVAARGNRDENRIQVDGRRQARIPTDEPATMQVISPLEPVLHGRVLDISRGGLKLCIDEPVDPGTLVRVRLGNALATAEIRYCVAVATGFHVGLQLDDVVLGQTIERRSEARIEADDPAFMQWLKPISPDRLPVKIVNTSKRGICIGSATFLARGADVRVFLGNVQLFGTIRYCVPAREGFRAGIELTGRIIQTPQRQTLQVSELRYQNQPGEPENLDFRQIVWTPRDQLPAYDFLEGDVEFVRRLAQK